MYCQVSCDCRSLNKRRQDKVLNLLLPLCRGKSTFFHKEKPLNANKTSSGSLDKIEHSRSYELGRNMHMSLDVWSNITFNNHVNSGTVDFVVFPCRSNFLATSIPHYSSYNTEASIPSPSYVRNKHDRYRHLNSRLRQAGRSACAFKASCSTAAAIRSYTSRIARSLMASRSSSSTSATIIDTRGQGQPSFVALADSTAGRLRMVRI